MSAVTPPPLQEPTSKEKKYDRQLRLWAASGQAALEESHVLLINTGTGTTGIEALKNLILPGLFSRIDHCLDFKWKILNLKNLMIMYCIRHWSLHNSRCFTGHKVRLGCELFPGRRERRQIQSSRDL